MLIEDELEILEILHVLLKEEGYQVIQVGAERGTYSISGLFSTIQTERPDIVLLDVHFRQLNGIDLLTLLKHDPETKNIQVVMSSGINLSEECKQKGADSFILKPYMLDDVIDQLNRFKPV